MSEKSKADLERVKRVIAALQKKTEENGCTEEEALAAAEKLGKLLEEHNLSMDEVGVREEAAACKKNEVFAADDFAGHLVVGIGKFCELIVYKSPGEGHAGKYVFFGTPHDLEIAVYLYEICAEAMEYDWTDFMEKYGYSLRKRQSFRQGFSRRVYDRLMQMKAERDARNASTCRDLIVLKDQLVTQEFSKTGIRLVKSRGGGGPVDPNAYRAGMAAGGRVNLNNPLGNPSSSADRLR